MSNALQISLHNSSTTASSMTVELVIFRSADVIDCPSSDNTMVWENVSRCSGFLAGPDRAAGTEGGNRPCTDDSELLAAAPRAHLWPSPRSTMDDTAAHEPGKGAHLPLGIIWMGGRSPTTPHDGHNELQTRERSSR